MLNLILPYDIPFCCISFIKTKVVPFFFCRNWQKVNNSRECSAQPFSTSIMLTFFSPSWPKTASSALSPTFQAKILSTFKPTEFILTGKDQSFNIRKIVQICKIRSGELKGKIEFQQKIENYSIVGGKRKNILKSLKCLCTMRKFCHF